MLMKEMGCPNNTAAQASTIQLAGATRLRTPTFRQRDHVENVFSVGSNPTAATDHARLAQLAEAACSNQVRSEFESPGAHETHEPNAFGYPALNGEMRVRIPPGARP